MRYRKGRDNLYTKDSELDALRSKTDYATALVKGPVTLAALGVVGFICVAFMLLFSSDGLLKSIGSTVLTGLGGVIAISVPDRIRVAVKVIHAVESRGKPDALPFIIEMALCDCMGKHTPKAVQVLITLLPQVREEDAIFFAPKHIDWMHQIVKALFPARLLFLLDSDGVPSTALCRGCIEALRYVGNQESVRLLERLLTKEPAEPYKELVSVVQRCLPILKTRLAKEQEARVLLRASSEPNVSPELLRPIMGSTQEPEQELLRPRE